MIPRTIIINYGMPRSGTTLIQKMLEQGIGYFHIKLSDFHPLHPMHRDDGLIRLMTVFRRRTVILVRTTRSVDALWESMQVGNAMGQNPPHTWSRLGLEDRADAEERQFQELLTHPDLAEHHVQFSPVQVEYEQLGDREYRAGVLARIARETPHPQTNRWLWGAYLEEVWQKQPVNVGRLMQSLSKEQE